MKYQDRLLSNDQKSFAKLFLSLTNRHNKWTVWCDFVTMFACAISNAVDKKNFDKREAMYMACIKKYSREELDVFPDLLALVVTALDKNPFQDFLGSLYMGLELGNDHTGQFFTPFDVCRAMAQIAVDGDRCVNEIIKDGYIAINDCTCGSGATMIAGCQVISEKLALAGNLNWQNHVMVYTQDIDSIAAMMCYIQLSLIGAAGAVKIGNTLTDPMCSGDDTSVYWYTPMCFSWVWNGRRVIKTLIQLPRECAEK